MDRNLNYPRFALSKKPHEKRPNTREVTFLSKSIENGHFSRNGKRGTNAKFSKMADFFHGSSEA